MNTSFSFRSLCKPLVMATLAVPIPALAANRFYVGPSGGSWNTPSYWTGAAAPVNGDSAVINTDVTVAFDGNYAPPGLASFDLDAANFATATLNHFSAGVMQVSIQDHVGYTGRGHYIQSAGAHITPSLTLGVNAGSNGQYDLSGGSLSPSDFWVGYAGVGSMTQTGGTVTVNWIRLGGLSTGNGTYTISNGSLSTNFFENGVTGTGYVQQQGGNVTTSGLSNGSHGSYNLNGGSFSGNLINDGAFSQSGGTFSGNVTNNNNISIGTGTFTVTAGGMVNYNQFGVYSATLVLNGTSTNQGSMQFSGNSTISGSAGFNNLGSIYQSSGTLTLNGGAVTNAGNMQLALGGGLNLNSVNFINNGTLTLNGARIGGSASLINRFGATISGNGLIAGGFDNQGGRLLLTSGTTLISNAFNNSGIIQLADDAASLAGGAITNSGEVSGHGSISNQISNIGGGMIEASGGTLTLGGVVNNGAGGILSAPAGGKLFLPGGLTTNGGLINLSGGYFDNNTSPINNTGQISGFGTIRTGGLANNGSVTLTGGFTTVNGSVVNSAGKQIKIAYNPALFTGAVTNNGIFKTTSTTVTFSGAYTENGTFISDPSDNYFSNVAIGASGAWMGGVGDRFFVSGDFVNHSANSIQWDTADAELHLLAGTGDVLAVNAKDVGISFDGYDNNFAWGMLSLAAGRSLTLVDADATPGGAIYVDHLDLQGGLDQIGNITGNGMTLYYHLGNPNNAYLDGKTYQLAGGGNISPVPEPAGVLGTMIFASLVVARRQIRRRRV